MTEPSMTGWHSWVLGKKQAEDWWERDMGKKNITFGLKRSLFLSEPWLNSAKESISDSLRNGFVYKTEKRWRALYHWLRWGNTCCCHGLCWLGPRWCPYVRAPRLLSPQALNTGRLPSSSYPNNLWALLTGPGKNRVNERELSKCNARLAQCYDSLTAKRQGNLWQDCNTYL